MCQQLDVHKRVHFVGEITQDKLAEWYAVADVFVFTSLREGMPNVVLEALSCGTAVVSMNKWGLDEIVEDHMGYLLENYDVQELADTLHREEVEKYEAEIAFEQRIAAMMMLGAKDEKMAFRWIMEADGLDPETMYGPTEWCYDLGLDFSMADELKRLDA